MARVHAQVLRELGGTEMVAWSAGHWHNAVRAAAEFGGEAMMTQDLLKHPGLDVILVSSPTALHHEHVIAALAAGRHVFCEKPMARTERQAEAMLNAARQSSGCLYVGHTLRFFPHYAKARELLRAGVIGTLHKVTCRRLNAMTAEDRSSWFFDFSQSGGCVLDLMIHDFDFLQWCLGRATRVEAETVPSKDPAGWQHAIVHLYFKGGARAEVEGSWLHHRHERALLFSGELGRITIDAEDGLLHVENNRGRELVPVPTGDGYRAQMRQFLDHVRHGTPLLVTPEDSYHALTIALTALRKLGKQ